MSAEILIIDDNSDIRLILNELILEAGYKTRLAANYNQALLEIDKKVPDVAIIDVKLDKGDADGIELLNHIKKKNKDILKDVSHLKRNRPRVILGFAAETRNHVSNARKKLFEKKCDAIIVNKINKYNDVFNSDFNKVTFITKKKKIDFKKMSKIKVAKHIVELIEKM